MQLRVINGYAGYQGETVLENLNFEICNKDKVALVGRNGCGKSTLLKLISGEIELMTHCSFSQMAVSKSKGMTIGVLKQVAFENENNTLLQEILEIYQPVIEMQRRLEFLQAQLEQNPTDELIHSFTSLSEKFEQSDGYFYQKEYLTALKQFSFEESDLQKKICEFSGGQLTRLALLKQLLSKPDLLLLDEPTNHLDVKAIEWLESFLKNYKKAFVLVSHDRQFLDNVINVVYEIEHKHIKKYVGNYTDFTIAKQNEYLRDKKAFERQEQEIARLSKTVERFRYKANKAKMAQSKLKQIERMSVLTDPQKADTRVFKANLTPKEESGNDVLTIKNLVIGYDKPLQNVSLEIKKGDKIAIVGANGVGKSTLLKTLQYQIPKISGSFAFGANVNVGYFDQQVASRPSSNTLFSSFADEFPRLTDEEVRNRLGRFLFSNDDVFKSSDQLSGGERVRLALAILFEKKPNFLILDEPTNHMDVLSKEAFEQMLDDFDATILFVSHDRYFVKKIATGVLEMEQGQAVYYPFDYETFLLEREKFVHTETKEQVEQKKEQAPLQGKQIYLNNKERQKNVRKIASIDKMLEKLENELDSLNKEYYSQENMSDYVKLNEIQATISQKEEEMLLLMEEKSNLQIKI